MIPIAHAGQLDGPTGSVTFPLTPALLDPNVVGSKAAGLAELLRIAGIRVPPAFIITTRAFDLLLASHPGTLSEIAELERLTDPDQIRQCALAIQQAVLAAPIPSMLRGLVVAAYKAFSAELGEEEVAASLSDYMMPDTHGDDHGQYQVTSLYYDTVDHKAYWDKIEGHRNRRKLRVRIYGNHLVTPETPCFVEIKHRLDRTLRKRRSLVPYRVAVALDQTDTLFVASSEQDRAVLEEAQYLYLSLIHISEPTRPY